MGYNFSAATPDFILSADEAKERTEKAREEYPKVKDYIRYINKKIENAAKNRQYYAETSILAPMFSKEECAALEEKIISHFLKSGYQISTRILRGLFCRRIAIKIYWGK